MRHVDDEALALRAQIRRERSAPLVMALGEWVETLRPLPQSGLMSDPVGTRRRYSRASSTRPAAYSGDT